MYPDPSPKRGDPDNTLLFKIAQMLAGGVAPLPGSAVNSFNGRTGVVTLTSGDVTGALSYTPLSQAAGDARYVLKAGDTMTGKLQFSGTTHVGLRLNNLTTGERNAIAAPTAGDIIWNTTTSQIDRYDGASWAAAGSGLYVLKAGDTMTGPLNMTAGQSYQYNSVNVIRAQTALDDYHFGPSGNLTMTGIRNTSVGVSALVSNTTGANNVAVGRAALLTNTIGANNVAFGNSALQNNLDGSNNQAIGLAALVANTSGGSNVAIGSNSLLLNTTGSGNFALGVSTLSANVSGSNNVGVGNSALLNTTANQNVGVGISALANVSSGSNNTAIGYATGLGITTGGSNTIIGANVTGLAAALSNNIIIADGAGNQRINVDSAGLVGFGVAAPSFHLELVGTATTSQRKIGINGVQVVYLPDQAAGAFAGSIFFGNGGASLSHAAGTEGQSNTGVGISALSALTSGIQNTALGFSALNANTDGNNNTALGCKALLVNTSGANNSAIGFFSLAANTTGINNMAMGSLTLAANTTGTYNLAMGYQTLTANTTASFNVAVGSLALLASTTSPNNTAIGWASLADVTTAATGQNTAIGFNTGRGITTGSNNTIIGANVTGLAAGLSNNIILADGAGTIRLQFDSTGHGTLTGFLSIASGTVTTSDPALSISQTWNGAGVTFTAQQITITNTASATDSNLFKYTVDGIDRFYFATIGQLFMTRQDATNSGVNFFQRKRGSTGGATNAVLGDATIGTLSHSAWDGTAYATGSRISGVADENWSNTAHGSRIDFYTTPSGTTAEQIVIRLNNVGQTLLLNGTAPLPTLSFQSDQNTGIYRVGTDHLGITANGAIVLGVGAAKLGFFATVAATPVAQQVSGANLTNNVTAGGTDDTIANYTDLITYANDAAAIRNDIYQLARKLKQVNDALRAYGLLT